MKFVEDVANIGIFLCCIYGISKGWMDVQRKKKHEEIIRSLQLF